MTWSRMADRIIRPTAPPTAPSGESVDTESRNAMPGHGELGDQHVPQDDEHPGHAPGRPAAATPVPGSRSGCQPNAAVPATRDITGRLTTPRVE